MANSLITKRALAAALKELMTVMPFSKITIEMICEKCGMNRKSFYYHFKDKYDLIGSILDIEYFSPINGRENMSVWDRFSKACRYFYANKEFYRKIIKMKGENPFYNLVRETILPVLVRDIKEVVNSDIHDFYVNFYADAVFCAFERWLCDPKCMPPERFAVLLKSCVHYGADHSVVY